MRESLKCRSVPAASPDLRDSLSFRFTPSPSGTATWQRESNSNYSPYSDRSPSPLHPARHDFLQQDASPTDLGKTLQRNPLQDMTPDSLRSASPQETQKSKDEGSSPDNEGHSGFTEETISPAQSDDKSVVSSQVQDFSPMGNAYRNLQSPSASIQVSFASLHASLICITFNHFAN